MTIVSIGKEIGENYLFEDYAWKSCIDRNIFKITLSGRNQRLQIRWFQSLKLNVACQTQLPEENRKRLYLIIKL